MGTGHSKKSQNKATKRQSELKYLGDRYPFGDDEILRLYRCHSYLLALRKKNSGDREARRSFLFNWSVYASTLNSDESSGRGEALREEASGGGGHDDARRKDRERLTGIVEGRILPLGFGSKLERALFLLQSDLDAMDDGFSAAGAIASGDGNVVEAPDSPDYGGGICNELMGAANKAKPDCGADASDDTEDLDFQRLEKFLEGLAACGRRGSRAALGALFNSCLAANGGQQGTADALEVLKVGYRLALAGAYLRADEDAKIAALIEAQEEEEAMAAAKKNAEEKGEGSSEDDNVDDGEQNSRKRAEVVDPEVYCIPPDEPQGQSRAGGALEAMASSLLEFSSKQSANSDPYGCSPFGMAPSSLEPVTTKDENKTSDEDQITLEALTEWAEQNAPLLSASLSTMMHQMLFPDKPYPPSRTPFLYPNLRGSHSAFFNEPRSELLFAFGCMSPSLGGAWHRLYTSESDGLSFNRLQLSLLGYGGPTLLIVKDHTTGAVFGAFTQTQWKESKDFYGNSDCFLYRIIPTLAVYRPRGSGSNFMYCNSEARSKGYDGLAHGLGFGGTSDRPRFFIPELFDGCVASSQDLTFERGPLLPAAADGSLQKHFDIESLEVWGVGGDEVVAGALGERAKQREIVAANIRKARKVDKAQFLDDFNSGIIESKAFKHRDQVRGRHDCHIEDDPRKGYSYEK